MSTVCAPAPDHLFRSGAHRLQSLPEPKLNGGDRANRHACRGAASAIETLPILRTAASRRIQNKVYGMSQLRFLVPTGRTAALALLGVAVLGISARSEEHTSELK